MYPAEAVWAASGDFVYISNRDGTEQKRDGITVFKVTKHSETNVTLDFHQYVPVGHYPRSMALFSGNLVVGNQKGNSLTVLKPGASGDLTVSAEIPLGASPAFVGVF